MTCVHDLSFLWESGFSIFVKIEMTKRYKYFIFFLVEYGCD